MTAEELQRRREARSRGEEQPSNASVASNLAPSKVRLVTSGLASCIAVGLLSEDKFCLMHVFSDCGKKNWEGNDGYKARLSKCTEKMGKITHVFLGYADEQSSTTGETYKLLSEWAGTLTPSFGVKEVGGAVRMWPGMDNVTFDPAGMDDYLHAKPPRKAGTFIQTYGYLTTKHEEIGEGDAGKPEAKAETKADAKPEVKAETKADAKPETKEKQ
jgi:hypothetical protein